MWISKFVKNLDKAGKLDNSSTKYFEITYRQKLDSIS